MLIAMLILAALVLAYANGSNDNFKAVATLYGSGAISYRRSLALATVAQLAGSLASVLIAGGLVKAFSGKGLLPPGEVGDLAFLVAVGLGASVAVLIATRTGIPISTTHALIGGMIGAGVALMPGLLAWGMLGKAFLLPLLISPLLALAAAALIYPVARFCRLRLGITAETCMCVGETVQPVSITADGAMLLASTGASLTVAEQSQCVETYRGRVLGLSAQRIVDDLHCVSGLALGFARGLNDTPKILGLVVAASIAGLNVNLALSILAVVMAVGGLIHSKRLAETLGKKVTAINRGQGLIANMVSSSLVIGASVLGSPVSTTHVSSGAIFGISAWNKGSNWKLVGEIVLAWIATLPLAGAIAYGLATALRS